MGQQQKAVEFPAAVKRFGFFLMLAVIAGMMMGWKVALPMIRNDRQEVVTDAGSGRRLKVGSAEVGVEIADSQEKQIAGLSGRQTLGEDEGMLFVYAKPGAYGFWMKEMNFDLDFIWISDGRVVEITEDVPKPNAEDADSLPVYQAKVPVEAMLEVNSGWAKRHDIKIGDEIMLE